MFDRFDSCSRYPSISRTSLTQHRTHHLRNNISALYTQTKPRDRCNMEDVLFLTLMINKLYVIRTILFNLFEHDYYNLFSVRSR